ncbi:CDP-alcohol phosphatidyltransferase family protein [Wangella sp. NEAU-J3]|nr:CDP-alcohol phosphatidyltransferase family protein [Jidongwangia harbinensis]
MLSFIAFVFGMGAAACFALQDRWWLVAGAALFHLSFVVDCMDGKIARLNDSGSMFGAWFDFIFDRIRVIVCTVALMGGQYARTGEVKFLWLATAVISLDLFRYLNSSQMAKIKRSMTRQLNEARGQEQVAPVETTSVTDEGEHEPAAADDRNHSPYIRMRNWLLRRRIRTHLFSGIEFEMTVFIIGPLIGFVFWTSIVAGVLLLAFEAALVGRLWQLTRRFQGELATALAEQPAGPHVVPQQRTPSDAGTGSDVRPEAMPTRV